MTLVARTSKNFYVDFTLHLYNLNYLLLQAVREGYLVTMSKVLKHLWIFLCAVIVILWFSKACYIF